MGKDSLISAMLSVYVFVENGNHIIARSWISLPPGVTKLMRGRHSRRCLSRTC